MGAWLDLAAVDSQNVTSTVIPWIALHNRLESDQENHGTRQFRGRKHLVDKQLSWKTELDDWASGWNLAKRGRVYFYSKPNTRI